MEAALSLIIAALVLWNVGKYLNPEYLIYGALVLVKIIALSLILKKRTGRARL